MWSSSSSAIAAEVGAASETGSNTTGFAVEPQDASTSAPTAPKTVLTGSHRTTTGNCCTAVSAGNHPEKAPTPA